MARKPKPWKRRGVYVSKINGTLTPLGKTEGEAAAELRRLTGSTAPATFAEIAARYLRTVDQRARDGEISPTTARTYHEHTAEATKGLGKRLACDLRGFDLLDWLATRPSLSVSSRAAYGRQARRVIRWAASVGLLDRDPLERCPLPSIQPRQRGATADDAAAMLAAVRSPLMRDLLRFVWLTGARIGEAARITAADCDLATGFVTLHEHKTSRKTGKPREIPLCPEAVAILERLSQKHPTGPLFVNRYGNAWQSKVVSQHLSKLAHRTGCPHVTPHMLRQIWATDAHRAGVPVKIAAGCLGHGVNVHLKHYVRVEEDRSSLLAAARKVREAG